MTWTPRVSDRAARFSHKSAALRRWMAFNFVGWLGIVVQLSALAVFTRWLSMHYLLATGLAVESAILHNFIWHERWTWSDRLARDHEGVWTRLTRFHLANGVLSLGGNLVLMKILVGLWSMDFVVANVVSITICSLLNFLASDRLVFRRELRNSAGGYSQLLCAANEMQKAKMACHSKEPKATSNLL